MIPPVDANPWWREPEKPNFNRRCKGHDYRRPAKYMVTIHKAEESPPLCRVVGNPAITDPYHPDFPSVHCYEAGEYMADAIRCWLEEFPQLTIPVYQIMPDHVHLCIDARFYLPRHLGNLVGTLKGMVSKRYFDLLEPELQPFFKRGFNDRIAFREQQWSAQKRYVADNPRRYLIKIHNRDLYYATWEIRLGDLCLHAKGNIMLLKQPQIEVVRFSRRFREEEYAAMVKHWRQTIDNCGTIISPFINPKEKEVRKYALAQGGNVIRICESPFGERFAPYGEEFEYMHTSQLLLIAPEVRREDYPNFYAYAQEMNRWARVIAETDWQEGDARIRRLR